MSAAGALAADGSATPTVSPNNNTTISPTPTATPTSVPTPGPREVFSTVTWDVDHASVQVSNNGQAIDVEAYIGSLSNKTTTHVSSGISTKVPTMTISATSGQIIRCWFKAYENGTLIDSMEVPVTVSTAASPTPQPETAIVTGIVMDSATNSPIAGATITFVPRDFEKNYPPVTTDSITGEFTTFGKMSPGIYYITTKADGYSQKTETIEIASGPQRITDGIKLDRSGSVSPTPTPVPSATPGPTPGSTADAWLNLLNNPTVCVSTIAVLLGAGVSATALYEWTLRQRQRRKESDHRMEIEDKAAAKETKEKK